MGSSAGGAIALNTGSAESALRCVIGDVLDMDAQTAAFGLAEVVDENMANAARVHAVENGEDLTDYTIIAFGGAAPLHAGRLCEKLGMQRLLVPPGAGVGSAIGFLRAPFSFEANRSVYMSLSDFNPALIATLLSELQAEATGFVRSCDAEAPLSHEFKAYMRYAGQGWEIPVSLSADEALNPTAEIFQHRFEEGYSMLFGRIVEGMDIEITVWAVNTATPSQAVQPVNSHPGGQAAAIEGHRSIFDAALNKPVKANIVQRCNIQEGQTVKGPAAITEDETTIILPLSRTAAETAKREYALSDAEIEDVTALVSQGEDV